MSDKSQALITAVLTTLNAASAVTAKVGSRIYTDVPDNATFPYMVVTLQSSPYDTKTETGMEHTLQISSYSRKPDPLEAMQCRAAVYGALNRNENALSNASVYNILFNGVSALLKEPDGKTWGAVTQFRVVTE